jgi:hypothetical protein
MVPSPSGDLYVSDGYRNSRVHRFSKDGTLISSWGKSRSRRRRRVPPAAQPLGRARRLRVRLRPREQPDPGLHAEGKFVSQWRDIKKPTDI